MQKIIRSLFRLGILMSDKEKNSVNNYNEYQELVTELKKELPNIILPSMGLYKEEDIAKIDGKDFIVSDKEVNQYVHIEQERSNIS